MDRMKEIAEQTAIRHKLLALGYVPLANDDKRCMLPGWSTLEVDHAMIEGWAGKLRYRATGVRLEKGLIMLDFDIDDEGVIDAILDAVPSELWEKLARAPQRSRDRSAKCALFARTETPFMRMASQTFHLGTEDPEDEDTVTHRLEVFGGKGGGRQAGVYGVHTAKPDGDLFYRWPGARDGMELTQIRLEDLPLLTLDEVDQLCQIVNRTMQENGYAVYQKAAHGLTEARIVYDLDATMTFETKDQGDLTLGELWAAAAEHGHVRLSASWLEGPSARNRTRCIASLTARGELQILETAAFQMHRRAEAEPKPPVEAEQDRLAALLAKGSTFFAKTEPPKPVGPEGSAPEDHVERAVRALVETYAYCPTEERSVMPLDGSGPMTLSAFTTLMKPYSLQVRGPKGGITEVNPAKNWVSHPDRLNVIGQRFLPYSEDRLVHTQEGLAINVYRPVHHDAPARHGDVWEAFMRHLLPDDRERDWFLNLLAAKAQRPWLATCGVVMVAPEQGTGRGTLFDIMSGLWGDSVVPVTSMQLMGGSGQGQYTDWAERALLVTCDEVLAGDDGGGSMTWKRREAYERIKGLVDPRTGRKMAIVRKGMSNYSARVYMTLVLATNNLNALPLAQDDRRFAVLLNTHTPLYRVPDVRSAIDSVRRLEGGFDPGFLSSVWQSLQQRTVVWEDVTEAPRWTVGRETMLAANEGDLEGVLEHVLLDTPGDYMLNEDLRRRMMRGLEAAGLTGEIKNWWTRVQDILSRKNRFGWSRMATRQHVVGRKAGGGEKRATVYYRDEGPGYAHWYDTPAAYRPALWAAANDLNSTTSKLQRAMVERGLSVVEGDGAPS